MKKTFLLSIIMLAFCFVTIAQDRTNFKAGFNAGIPVGDFSEAFAFSVGVDVAYHYGVSELIDLGAATGYINIFGDTVNTIGEIEAEFEDYSFMPVAASLRIYPTYHFKFGADVGYAVATANDSEGGLYYRPVIGYNITGNTELNVSYMAIDNDGTLAVATLGLLFLF
ncbi:MAG: hypothetical protein ABJN84_02985 [Flavobacteriaceae bacterium]